MNPRDHSLTYREVVKWEPKFGGEIKLDANVAGNFEGFCIFSISALIGLVSYNDSSFMLGELHPHQNRNPTKLDGANGLGSDAERLLGT